MPIEIKELTIKVNVNTPQQSGGHGSSQSITESQAEKQDSGKIISAAVEQIMELIRSKNER